MVIFGLLVWPSGQYFWPSGFYLFGRSDSASWVRLFLFKTRKRQFFVLQKTTTKFEQASLRSNSLPPISNRSWIFCACRQLLKGQGFWSKPAVFGWKAEKEKEASELHLWLHSVEFSFFPVRNPASARWPALHKLQSFVPILTGWSLADPPAPASNWPPHRSPNSGLYAWLQSL